MKKLTSILSAAFFLGAFPGCGGAAYVSHPIVWREARFVVTWPCQPEAYYERSSAARTEFGLLRYQTFGCKDPERDVEYVMTAGIFEAHPSASMSEHEKKQRDIAIVEMFARRFCNDMNRKGIICSAGRPFSSAQATQMQLTFGKRDIRIEGRVKVSYPHLTGVMVLSRRFVGEMGLALDIQLPKRAAAQ
jgi:hypothetical protein